LRQLAVRLASVFLLGASSSAFAQPDSSSALVPYYLSLASSVWPPEPLGALVGALGLRWPEGPGWPVTSIHWPANRRAFLLAWGRRPGRELDPVDGRACLLSPDGTVRWNRPITLYRDPMISDDLISCFVDWQPIDSVTTFGRPIHDAHFSATWLDSTGTEIGRWALMSRDAFGPGTFAFFSKWIFRPGANDMLFLQTRAYGWERSTSTADDIQPLVSVSFQGRENWRVSLENRYDSITMAASGDLIVLLGSERLPERDSADAEFYRLDAAFLHSDGRILAAATDQGLRGEWAGLVDPRGDRYYYILSSEVRSFDITAGGVPVEPDSVRLRELCAYPDSMVASTSRSLLNFLRYFRGK